VSDTDHLNDDRNVRKPADDRDGAWVDPEVLEGVRQRSPQALSRFFDAAFPYVYSLAYRLSGNREAAEDIAQDVFLRVYQAADRLETDRHPKPWLTTITYNACRDSRRRAAARPETVEDGMAIVEQQADPTTPEDVLLQKEREQLIEKALLELDEESRAVVLLHDYSGTSHEDIAVIMGSSHAAVRKRYSRALKRMAGIIRGLENE
jgi:RNA polymerase sigma-70 factor (ECF subfamily)